MTDINKLVRQNVLNLTPYSCARDEFKGSSGIFLDANENPFGRLNRYPDPYQKNLKNAISQFKGVAADRIFLGNGSDEIIDLCFRIFCNPGVDRALVFTPTYGMYEVSASANDVKVIKVPLDADFEIDMNKTKPHLADRNLKIIFICSPNNPTSNSMDKLNIEYLISGFGGIVVIDEAYVDFSDRPSLLPLTTKYNNLVIMQTFSKAFGLAAARVGMAFTSPEIVRLFNKMKPPYNISTINQKAALGKMGRLTEYREQVKKIKKERARLASLLAEMPLTEKVYPSDANFLLVKVKDANVVYNALVERNIVVRNRHAVMENCIRITVGKKNENDNLIKALNSIKI